MPTSPFILQEGNPELGPSLGTETEGDRAKELLCFSLSPSAGEAALSMKFTLIYC